MLLLKEMQWRPGKTYQTWTKIRPATVQKWVFSNASEVFWELLPGTAAGDRGPVREGVTLAGEPTGDGEGPRMPVRWGEVCGEKGDWAGLLCSPWLLDTPEVLTPGLRAPSVPVGRSSMEPDRSWKKTIKALVSLMSWSTPTVNFERAESFENYQVGFLKMANLAKVEHFIVLFNI